MTGIEDVHESTRHIAPVRLRLRRIEGQIVLAPNDEKSWLRLAHPRLPLGIAREIGAVVVEEIALNLGLARPPEKADIVRPEVRVVTAYVLIVADRSIQRGPDRDTV